MLKPGDIVKLNTAFKPTDPDRQLIDAVAPSHHPPREWYNLWSGFTHGIVVQMITATDVSLHLYDPVKQLIYVSEYNHGIPTYVDYSEDELTLIKDGAVLGYRERSS